jgi:hypothetical protein
MAKLSYPARPFVFVGPQFIDPVFQLRILYDEWRQQMQHKNFRTT